MTPKPFEPSTIFAMAGCLTFGAVRDAAAGLGVDAMLANVIQNVAADDRRAGLFRDAVDAARAKLLTLPHGEDFALHEVKALARRAGGEP